MGLLSKLLKHKTKIKLNHDDFKCLIRGGELTIKTDNAIVKMILDDIGFTQMISDIVETESGVKNNFYVPLTRKENDNGGTPFLL